MSVDVYVIIRQQDLPTTGQWQSAIDDLGVDLVVDTAIELATHRGFLPVYLGGQPSGFELFSSPASDVLDDASAGEVGDRDLALAFVTHSDITELRCSMLAASALATIADGVSLDYDSGAVIDASTLLEQAHSVTDG